MENGSEAMFAQMMAAMAAGAQEASEEGPSSGAVTFFERSNAADASAPGVFSRMTFTGCFAIDDFMIRRKDGTPVEAGLGADFDEAGGPVAAGVWFSRPVNRAVEEKFETFFGASFDEGKQRMDIEPATFLDFADSKAWGVYEQEEDEDPLW